MASETEMVIRRLLLLAGLCAAAAGCELTEVVTPPGEDVLVVEAVLRADARPQHFLLHRSLDGRVMGGAPGAAVSVITSEGAEVLFREDAAGACARWLEEADTATASDLDVRATCYTSPAEAGAWVVAGKEYELRIETADGRRVRGRTRVPGAFDFRLPLAPSDSVEGVPYCTLAPDSVLRLVWSSSPGAWVYLASLDIFGLGAALAERGIEDIPEPLRLTGISISEADTTLILPTQFGVFERAELDQTLLRALQGGLPPGVWGQVVIAAFDRNLVNAVRGGAFNPSGNVRISSVVGDGVGVFGSLVPLSLAVAVAEDASSRCRGLPL
ncbi:MAG TPA: DUF4249 family protein [Longimicrobiaceae bacterium]|nr:DUF4249 family protein [Longimicrobiaceae bacterium]